MDRLPILLNIFLSTDGSTTSIALIVKFLSWAFNTVINNNKSVTPQPQRANTDWSGCCQMTVQGTFWLAKRLSLNLNFGFLNRISLLLYQVATQLTSRGWVDPVLEKFLGYSRESNPGPLGWQSDVLTTIPNRWSIIIIKLVSNF